MICKLESPPRRCKSVGEMEYPRRGLLFHLSRWETLGCTKLLPQLEERVVHASTPLQPPPLTKVRIPFGLSRTISVRASKR